MTERPFPPVDVSPRQPSADAVPVVLIHGFLGCAEDMEPLARHVATRRRALAVDLPGHGPAPLPVAGRGNPYFAIVDDLVARLLHAGVDRFDLVGYSMGGRVVCGILVRHAGRVRRAALIGASPGIEDDRLRRARGEGDRRLAERLRTEPHEAFLDWWYGQRLFADLKAHPSYPDLVARRRQSDPDGMARALLALTPGLQPPLWDDLAALDTPMLFVAGERDLKYARLVADAARRFKNTRPLLVPDAGHAVHVERADDVGDAVASFLDEPGP